MSSFLEMELQCQSDLFELATCDLEYWQGDFQSNNQQSKNEWDSVADKLVNSYGFIFICPEWGGMVPPILKNFLQMSSTREVGDKPALLISVSSGMDGAYPISELRASGYKNNRICFIPDQIIIRNCNLVFVNDGIKKTDYDLYYRRQLKHHCANLINIGMH